MATKKPLPLSYKQLSAHDDVITDALLDHVYFWTTIRKNHLYYRPERSLNENQIATIIQRQVILDENVKEATLQLLQLPAIKKYLARLPKNLPVEYFTRHLEKYVQTYLPDCPFEVTTTNRYTITEMEAAVTARQNIKRGTIIKYLCGTMVNLTIEEEAELDVSKRSFSIVHSSRKKTMSLFLGPARLANHDCRPNARLTSLDSNKMEVTALENIAVNQEITVSYGDDYFGLDNCECLCATCERLARNGWAAEQQAPLSHEVSLSTEPFDPWGYSLRSQREKRKLPLEFMLTPDFSTPDALPDAKRRKSQSGTPKAQVIEANLPSNNALAGAQDRAAAPMVDDVPPKLNSMTLHQTNEDDAASSYTAAKPPAPMSNGLASSHPTPTTTVSEVDENLLVIKEEPQDSPIAVVLRDATTHIAHPVSAEQVPKILVGRESPGYTPPAEVQSYVAADLQGRDVSVLVERLDELQSLPVMSKREAKGRILLVKDSPKRKRIPGDYLNDKSLLSKPASKRLVCYTCSDSFIQENAYEPHAECPRCERHSKLHGFTWPKSRRADENDKEIRYLDHRHINRTLAPGWRSCNDSQAIPNNSDATERHSAKQTKPSDKPPLKGGIWKGWVPFEQEWEQMRKNAKKAGKRVIRKPKTKQKSKKSDALGKNKAKVMLHVSTASARSVRFRS